jgi:hypothetical protein
VLTAGLTWYTLDARAKERDASRILVTVFNDLSPNKKIELLRLIMDAEGADAGWRMLELAQVPGVGPLPYFIGTYMYEKKGSSGIRECPETFLLGCRGGLLKAAVAAEGLAVIENLENECEIAGLGQTCGHGLGHGFSQFADFNIQKALEYCDLLTANAQIPCYGGVFQEYWEFAPDEKFMKNSIWEPCTGLDDRHRSVCAFNLRDQWGVRYGFDNTKSMQLCLSVHDRTIKLGCMLGIGFKIVKEQDGDVGRVVDTCSSVFPEDYRPLCLISAANVFAVYKYVDWRESIFKVCRLLTDDLRSTCRNAAEIKTLFATASVLEDFDLDY